MPDIRTGAKDPENRVQDHQLRGSKTVRYGTRHISKAFKKPRPAKIPCDGFYEWRKSPRRKILYFDRHEGQFFNSCLAGLWEGLERSHEWTNGYNTCTIITCEPNEFVRQIHARMPVILPQEQSRIMIVRRSRKRGFDPLPRQTEMKAWPDQSAGVNSPKNNDFEIVTPIETESVSLPENSSANCCEVNFRNVAGRGPSM